MLQFVLHLPVCRLPVFCSLINQHQHQRTGLVCPHNKVKVTQQGQGHTTSSVHPHNKLKATQQGQGHTTSSVCPHNKFEATQLCPCVHTTSTRCALQRLDKGAAAEGVFCAASLYTDLVLPDCSECVLCCNLVIRTAFSLTAVKVCYTASFTQTATSLTAANVCYAASVAMW